MIERTKEGGRCHLFSLRSLRSLREISILRDLGARFRAIARDIKTPFMATRSHRFLITTLICGLLGAIVVVAQTPAPQSGSQAQTPGPTPAPTAPGQGRGRGGGGRKDDPINADVDWTKQPPVLPKTPEEELKQFILQPGYRLELVLADPIIQEPTAIAFDGNGRMFVVEDRS